VLLAHYLKLILTGNEWFIHPFSANFSNEACHKMILKFIQESDVLFASVFGEQYSIYYNEYQAIIEGCMIEDAFERIDIIEVWKKL
jgi:phage terminase small subunit